MILNDEYKKLSKTSNPPMTMPITSTHKTQPLSLDSYVGTGDEAGIK